MTETETKDAGITEETKMNERQIERVIKMESLFDEAASAVSALEEALDRYDSVREKLQALETEDLILLLILYLMYRESGDSELLYTMAAMILL